MDMEVLERVCTQTQFVLQRWQLERMIAQLPAQAAITLIRYMYECNYDDAYEIYKKVGV